MKFKHIRSIFVGLFIMGMTACSHGPMIQEFQETASATDEVQRLDSDIHVALGNQVNVLAPTSFLEAQKFLDEAKASQEQNQNAKDVLHTVAVGRAYLERANEASKMVNNSMGEVVIARKQALDTGAATSFEKEFKAADENLQGVTADIEQNHSNVIESNRRALQTAYLDLELKAITQNALAQVRVTVDQAKNEGAKDYAARSLAETDKKIQDTDAYIVANRHETNEIKARSTDAQISADHLLKITRVSKANKTSSSEDVALKLDAKQSQLENKQEELSGERNSVKILATQRNKLESERAFDQKFEEARAVFAEGEAEVYRQGNRLTIRLKGLEFPIAKAELRSSNYPLMAKVQKVIKSFGKSTISVEGNTDSDGGKVMNERLSAARAQSVSSYLVSTATIDQADIIAVGNGYQKPLASNKSVAGKAQNRRVDVIITPHEIL